jgi:thioredoxin-related protein
MKKISVYLLLISILIAVGYLFYQEDIKNSLPTEVPKNYVSTSYGQKFDIRSTKKLTLMHFFDPDCPCSKFNTKNIENLKNLYGEDIEFSAYSNSYIPENYPIKVNIDFDGKMAKLLGVYSTPQAVLLDDNGVLIYRGNYNKSRYCTNKNTQFVALAIESALKNQNTFSLMQNAGRPYGCQF